MESFDDYEPLSRIYLDGSVALCRISFSRADGSAGSGCSDAEVGR
jgi:hypothetical protein